MLSIQVTPNLSVHMPNKGDQKVGDRGIVALPPSLSAAKSRRTSRSIVAVKGKIKTAEGLALARIGVGSHERDAAQRHGGVHDEVFGLFGGADLRRCLAPLHRHQALGAEHGFVEGEGGITGAVEGEVHVGVHGALLVTAEVPAREAGRAESHHGRAVVAVLPWKSAQDGQLLTSP